MDTYTYRVKFLASNSDGLGYTNYVFENLEYTDYDYKYIMCVRFPNWEQSHFEINDIGFLTIRYVEAGVDKWFDGSEFHEYKYTNIIFLKFIPESNINLDEVIID